MSLVITSMTIVITYFSENCDNAKKYIYTYIYILPIKMCKFPNVGVMKSELAFIEGTSEA